MLLGGVPAMPPVGGAPIKEIDENCHSPHTRTLQSPQDIAYRKPTNKAPFMTRPTITVIRG